MSTTSNQYYQILRTYWRRPLVLLLAAVFAICVGVLAFGPSDEGEIEIAPSPEISWFQSGGYFVMIGAETSDYSLDNGFPAVAELLERVSPDKVRGLELNAAYVENSALPDLSPFRKLKALSLDGYTLTSDDVDKICQLPRLRMLALYRVELPAGGLQRLGQKATELGISASLLAGHSEEISQMSKVRTLSLTIAEDVPDLLDHAVQAPRIERLTLANNLDEMSFDILRHLNSDKKVSLLHMTGEQIELIRQHPTLREIYADWSHVESAGEFNDETLRPVRALPLTYSSARRDALLNVAFSTVVLFVILTLQVWAHFVSPAAAVVPNYVRAHQRVAAGILLGAVLLLWVALLRYAFSPLPSLASVLIVPIVCCVFVQASLMGSKLLQWLMLLVVFCVVFPAMYLLTDFKIIASDAIWFLRGHMPLLALSIIVCAVLGVLWTLKSLPVMTVLVNEKFATLPVFWYSDRSPKLQRWKRNNWLLRLLDTGIRGLRYRQRTLLQMANLWRRGNPFRTVAVLMFLTLIVVCMQLPLILGNLMTGQAVWTWKSEWVVGPFASAIGVGLLLPAGIWWRRCRHLEVESMKPVSRRSLRKQLYVALALDHWLVWIGLLGFIVVRDWEAFGGVTALTGARVLFGIAVGLWILGTNATVFVYKRAWVVVGWMIAFYAVAAVALAPVLEWSEVSSAELTQLYFTSALVAVPAAIGLNVVMYRAMLKRRWG
jgi:hypothetical protein